MFVTYLAFVMIFLWYFIGIMMKSNNISKLKIEGVIAYTEINSETGQTYSMVIPNAGWITKARIIVTPVDHDATYAFSVFVGTGEDWGYYNNDSSISRRKEHVSDGWGTGGNVSSMSDQNLPKFFYIMGGRESVIEKSWNMYEKCPKGRVLNSKVELENFGNTLTAGSLKYRIEIQYHLGAFRTRNEDVSSSRGDAHGMQVSIIGSFDETHEYVYWAPPCNGRIVNSRITLWNAYDHLGNANAGEFVFWGKMPSGDIELDESGAWVEMPDGLILDRHYIDSGIGVEWDIVTNYRRSREFIKYGEFMLLRFHGDSTTDLKLELEFDFIPDFDKHVTKNYAIKDDDIGDSPVLKVLKFPFDEYVDKLTVEVRLNATVDGVIYFAAVKTPVEDLTNMTITQGSLVGDAIITDEDVGVLPNNIIGQIHLKGSKGSTEPIDVSVNDYYPANSMIAVVWDIDAPGGTEDLDIGITVHGFSRVKSSRAGTNILEGTKVLRQEIGVN